MNETKGQKFSRLATGRTKNVLKALQVLGHCANRSVYEYSEKEVQAIFQAIDRQLKSVKERFSDTSPTKIDFKL